MLIDLRSAVSLDDSPLFLGTYIILAILVEGLGVLFMEEKAVPKLVMIPSSLSILVESRFIFSLTKGSFSLNFSKSFLP